MLLTVQAPFLQLCLSCIICLSVCLKRSWKQLQQKGFFTQISKCEASHISRRQGCILVKYNFYLLLTNVYILIQLAKICTFINKNILKVYDVMEMIIEFFTNFVYKSKKRGTLFTAPLISRGILSLRKRLKPEQTFSRYFAAKETLFYKARKKVQNTNFVKGLLPPIKLHF